MPQYLVVYDGWCNLCTTLVQLLESLDQGQQFRYLPMQSPEIEQWQITAEVCQQGMILLSLSAPDQRWQGSDAAEEIGRLLPLGHLFISAYRAIPGLKTTGDRGYAWVRDHRYQLFGQQSQLYTSVFTPDCQGQCQGFEN